MATSMKRGYAENGSISGIPVGKRPDIGLYYERVVRVKKRQTEHDMTAKDLNSRERCILDKLLEQAYEGIVVVDADGVITSISKAYAEFLGIKPEDAVGQAVGKVIENTRLPEILKSGKVEKAHLQLIRGNPMIASRFPLIKDGRIIGAIGMVLFRNIEELDTLRRRIANLQRQVESFRTLPPGRVKYSFQSIIGGSEKILQAKAMAEKAAATDSNVLLLGESGTGKELFAHAIHHAGARSNKPLVKVNCAAIPAELLESELFGYEAGAFTGARRGGKAGKFETADGGTLFLDEIGDMAHGMQSKLLRALQEKEIEKIGSNYPLAVDVRIIAATNQNLEQLVDSGKFRADLFYRLNVVSIKIPALRERVEDIDLLAPALLDEICNHLGRYVDEISPTALRHLKRQSWPGNIRELKNALERAVNLIGSEGVIEPGHLAGNGDGHPDQVAAMQYNLEQTERLAIKQALAASGNKKARAARLLKISRSNLYHRMRKLKM